MASQRGDTADDGPAAKVRIVCATTKKTEEEFRIETPLGRSLTMFPPELKPEVNVKLDNTGPTRIGLAKIYNMFLRPQYRDEIALFVHDDVYLNDWLLVYRLREAMRCFDVVGVAGNVAPDFAEPSWALGWNTQRYPTGWQPRERLSGTVGHPSDIPNESKVTYYGPAPRACRMLDGLFLAVSVDRAVATSAFFDEQFEFHFYDMDFCRTAEACGLRLGTWPITVTHSSGGAFKSEEWLGAMKRYSDKWPVTAERDKAFAPVLKQRFTRILEWPFSRGK